MRVTLCLLVAALTVQPVSAQEETHYTYDALGRLNNSYRESGPNAGHITKYRYDAADNRQNVTSKNVVVNLQVDQFIQSADGRFLLYMQSDGNLVLYFGPQALWYAPGTWGTTNQAFFQVDGNFVVYGPSGPLWSAGVDAPGSEMVLQNDGNLVIYSPYGVPLWSTNTGGH